MLHIPLGCTSYLRFLKNPTEAGRDHDIGCCGAGTRHSAVARGCGVLVEREEDLE